MDKFLIYGGEKLFGTVKLDCAKNAILPIMAASIMADDVTLLDVPDYLDIQNMEKILSFLGIKVTRKNKVMHISTIGLNNYFVPITLAKELRSSIFVLGPLLSKLKKAKVAYPGGCEIGLRPIDLHLKGLQELGVKIEESHGYIFCDGSKMKSGVVNLDFQSVGATENIMMASVLLEGKTIIHNPAKEPEIVDLQNFLNSLGAHISGAGTDNIEIIGTSRLGSTTYSPISDRIICGTMLIACAMCGGKIVVENARPEHFFSLINKLQKSGCKINLNNDKITIESKGKLKSVGLIKTLPYPGFPTDLMPQMLAMQTISKGCCVVQENLFETRFKFAQELLKMGAKITIKDRIAFVCGVKNLSGADVFAHDLRGGAALVLAGLCAKGYTTVHNVYHIDRGYNHLENTLSSLGAKIIRQSEE